MLIDTICERREAEVAGMPYHAIDLYCSALDTHRHDVSSAMDYGTEDDVRNALCAYIDRNGYSPDLKTYIRSRVWLTDDYTHFTSH